MSRGLGDVYKRQIIGSPHKHHATHRHKRFIFTLTFVIMASAVAIGASIYSFIKVQKIAEEVSTMKSANLITLDSNIQHLLASKDLAAIVKTTVAISNKDGKLKRRDSGSRRPSERYQATSKQRRTPPKKQQEEGSAWQHCNP